MLKVGAHVSASISLDLSLERAHNIKAQCSQIFISPPQQWAQIPHESAEINKYLEAVKKYGVAPNFIHATYLINLASASSEHFQKSIDWLIYALDMAASLQSPGVVVHLGSHKGRGLEAVLDQVCQGITDALHNELVDSHTYKPYLIIENTAGGGGSIGANFMEIGKILKTVNDPQVKVCLDTQHAFASGYELKNPQVMIKEFESEIGLDNLVVIHANDSKTEFASKRDRHENIGEGFIGKEGFKSFLKPLSHLDLPLILEVPGFGNSGPDSENITILKDLVKSL